MRISYWSSDVCSSDLQVAGGEPPHRLGGRILRGEAAGIDDHQPLRDGDGGERDDHRRDAQVGDAEAVDAAEGDAAEHRAEERRVGRESVSTGRYRGSPSHIKKIRKNS